MCKPDGPSRRLGEENSGIDTQFFDDRELLDLENNDVGEEEDAEDVELEGINVARSEKQKGLQAVLQERRL